MTDRWSYLEKRGGRVEMTINFFWGFLVFVIDSLLVVLLGKLEPSIILQKATMTRHCKWLLVAESTINYWIRLKLKRRTKRRAIDWVLKLACGRRWFISKARYLEL